MGREAYLTEDDLVNKCLAGNGKNTYTRDENRNYVCHYCGKKYKSPNGLRPHILNHMNRKPFKCSYCGRGFTTSGFLGNHVRVHTDERPYACTQCGNRFRQKRHLKDHVEMHRRTGSSKKTFLKKLNKVDVGESVGAFKDAMCSQMSCELAKRFACQYCGRRFGTVSALYGHIKMHGSNKNKYLEQQIYYTIDWEEETDSAVETSGKLLVEEIVSEDTVAQVVKVELEPVDGTDANDIDKCGIGLELRVQVDRKRIGRIPILVARDRSQ